MLFFRISATGKFVAMANHRRGRCASDPIWQTHQKRTMNGSSRKVRRFGSHLDFAEPQGECSQLFFLLYRCRLSSFRPKVLLPARSSRCLTCATMFALRDHTNNYTDSSTDCADSLAHGEIAIQLNLLPRAKLSSDALLRRTMRPCSRARHRALAGGNRIGHPR